MSWRPELTVEDIVQHSKGRRDPQKNRQYFVEYRRKMKAAAKKPACRASRQRCSGSAAAARDNDMDAEGELTAAAEEEDEGEDEAQKPGQSLHAGEGGAVWTDLCGTTSLSKCSSAGAGACSSSVPSGSEGESILPNGPVTTAGISAVASAPAAPAAAATLDATGPAAVSAGAQQLPEVLLPSAASAPLGAHFRAGVVTQVAVCRTRGPSTFARSHRGSTSILRGGEGANCSSLSHQGSIRATSAGIAAATATAAVACTTQLPLPQETLLPVDLGGASGAWGCGGLAPYPFGAADWESHSAWPVEADAAPPPVAGCETAAAAEGAGLATGVSPGNSSDSSAADVWVGSSTGPLEPVLAPILPPVSSVAACAAAAVAAAAVMHPAESASALPLEAARRVCGWKRPHERDPAYGPSTTSGIALAQCQDGPFAKQQQLPRQLSGVLISPGVREGSTTSISSISNSGWAHLSELLLPQLSPAPCEPALPPGLSGTTGYNGVTCCGPCFSASLLACGHPWHGLLEQQQAGSTLPVTSLLEGEEAGGQALHPQRDGPAAASFGAAAQAEGRADEEEAGVDALGWIDSLLVDPQALDGISGSPWAPVDPLPHAGCGWPVYGIAQEQQAGHAGAGSVSGGR
ncbi:hypothetical protein HXX76_010930 [Chlamydomonas incerta]|uniref:Uncharacterized protein n=1 Tax=Chlamydomonas incerta TaxID=51695 RepID=A0A835VVN7_CHLIN|nr:hypothetical protein HXX76_010930 [Chlamydomonas incerta]|eukprot:KAG2427214.1 hypothetical protein HXX76_010930 [Chlamydomonas incerta]